MADEEKGVDEERGVDDDEEAADLKVVVFEEDALVEDGGPRGSVLTLNDEPDPDAFNEEAAPTRIGEEPLTEDETSGLLEAGEERAALSGSLWAGVEATRASLARTCEGSRQCCWNNPAQKERKESATVLRLRARVQRETNSVLSQGAQSSRSSAVRHSGVLAELDQGVVAVSVLEAEDRAEPSVVLQDDLKVEAAVGQSRRTGPSSDSSRGPSHAAGED